MKILQATAPLFICIGLSSCGSSSNDVATTSSTACTISSSPFPVTTSGITAAPSRPGLLYEEIYAATASAAASKGFSNPLTVTPLRALVGDDRYYAAAVEAYVWGLPAEQFWEKQGLYLIAAALYQLTPCIYQTQLIRAQPLFRRIPRCYMQMAF